MQSLPAKAALLLSRKNRLQSRIYSFLNRLDSNVDMRKYLEKHYRQVLGDGNQAKTAASYQMGKKSKLRTKEWYFQIIFGASTETLRNWVDQISSDICMGTDDSRWETELRLQASREQEQQKTIARIVATLEAHISCIEGLSLLFPEPLQIDDFSDQVDVYRFGARLCLSELDVQMEIDRQFWKTPRPQFGYYIDQQKAEKYSEEHVGLYLMFHRAPFCKDSILQSTLRIRYTLEVNAGTYIVRCKLHIPRLDDGININVPYFSYDGYVTDRGDDTFKFWYFEKNKQGLLSKNDMIDMISTSVSGRCATALLMTIWTNERSSVYSTNAILVKQQFDANHMRDTTFARAFMREHSRIHQHPEHLIRHLHALSQRNDVGLHSDDIDLISSEFMDSRKSIVISPPGTHINDLE